MLAEFGSRKCKSMIAFDNDKEEDPRKIRTYPLSPNTLKEYSLFDRERPEPLDPPDNVYAESKPANPLG